MKTFIYGLYSSDSKIRYIGKSDDPKKRLRRHLQQVNDSKTHKNSWIKKQLSENKEIKYLIIEEVSIDNWKEREKYWISKFDNLTNTSSGGLGGSGKKYNISYEDCKNWIFNNLDKEINSKTKWILNCKNLPISIPRNPTQYFKNNGWISWGDFLGTNNIQDNLKINYLSYDDVKNWIVLQNIKTTSKNWKLLNLPNFIPRRPERYYKKRGWISWSDFLSDNNRISNLDKKRFKNYI